MFLTIQPLLQLVVLDVLFVLLMEPVLITALSTTIETEVNVRYVPRLVQV